MGLTVHVACRPYQRRRPHVCGSNASCTGLLVTRGARRPAAYARTRVAPGTTKNQGTMRPRACLLVRPQAQPAFTRSANRDYCISAHSTQHGPRSAHLHSLYVQAARRYVRGQQEGGVAAPEGLQGLQAGGLAHVAVQFSYEETE